ncbi:hypothetical protein JJL45_05145 [Tamlana sp. s12]|uniref:hypothetical protein n=1 Tax=Tamlana sp. s12 TaxID=1630406 RepID=UPI0007FF2A9B|nr:hypothetical protein [Tamlana sp. s12]OBQ56110.1 hypothetical protein VQ01_06915 [Tamlana sp. s12]QQY83377.1 hypothetical protein JJL45_05145 [Tamlana sp. s12]
MNTLEFPERNLNMYLPEDLSECDTRQYIEVSSLMFKYNEKEINFDAFKSLALYKLLNLKLTKNLCKEDEVTKNENIALLSVLIESFFEPIDNDNPNDPKIIKQNFIHNPLPKIAPTWCTYYGPSNAFKNITFGEYIDGLNFFFEYEKTKDTELLYLLMAVFYRKTKPFHFIRKTLPNYNGDRRIRYNDTFLEKRAKKLKVLPEGYVYGFYLFFSSFHKYLTTAEITLNGEQIKIGKLFGNDDPEKASSDLESIGFKSIEYQISESGVFGTNKDVRNTNLWEILIKLYDMYKSHKDHLARSKKAESEAKQKAQQK